MELITTANRLSESESPSPDLFFLDLDNSLYQVEDEIDFQYMLSNVSGEAPLNVWLQVEEKAQKKEWPV